MMDTIPHDLIVAASCHTSPYCKDELSLKSLLKKPQYLLSLGIVRKIGGSVCPWEVDISSFSRIHRVVDSYCSHIRITITAHTVSHTRCHRARRLIPNHHPIDTRTYRAFYPLIGPLEHGEARSMDDMTTRKNDDILIRIFHQLILEIINVLEFELANTTFVFTRLFAFQNKLEEREVRVGDYFVGFEASSLLLLLEERKEVVYLLVQLVLLIYLVVLVELRLVDTTLQYQSVIMSNLLSDLLNLLCHCCPLLGWLWLQLGRTFLLCFDDVF